MDKEKNIAEGWLQKTSVVWFGLLLCCALWGNASSCIKLGHAALQNNTSDTAAQILFIGIRFMLAGVLTILIGNILAGEWLRPRNKNFCFHVVKLSLLHTVLQNFFFCVGLVHTT